MKSAHIILKNDPADGAEYDLLGEKTDLKDLLFSLMEEDTVFASLCAIAVQDYCSANNIDFETLADWQKLKL